MLATSPASARRSIAPHRDSHRLCGRTLYGVRDLETIDAELRMIAAVRWSIREHGGVPSSRPVDELPDERLRDGETDC